MYPGITAFLLLGNRFLILLQYEQFCNEHAWRSSFASCPHAFLGSIVLNLLGQGLCVLDIASFLTVTPNTKLAQRLDQALLGATGKAPRSVEQAGLLSWVAASPLLLPLPLPPPPLFLPLFPVGSNLVFFSDGSFLSQV